MTISAAAFHDLLAPCLCPPHNRWQRYAATMAARHTQARLAHPDTLSATEAMALSGKLPRSFYSWLRRHGIAPVLKLSHLTLYSRLALLEALRPPAPGDELAARRRARGLTRREGTPHDAA